ncbi:Hypothetical predicted protein [Cloeon dipterum]|uniref:Uncharacterized protein n=1 Tax=Cloeon dipterum TaxID=197152 RepID=A0A8S1CHJ8_9INSE|nr:Hypothetical predicted protein [Cloeon dipterum]
MATHNPVDIEDVCRICEERFDERHESVDIFESGPADGFTYAKVIGMTQLYGEPNEGDGLPRRIGIECARYLEKWLSFKTAVSELETKNHSADPPATIPHFKWRRGGEQDFPPGGKGWTTERTLQTWWADPDCEAVKDFIAVAAVYLSYLACKVMRQKDFPNLAKISELITTFENGHLAKDSTAIPS